MKNILVVKANNRPDGISTKMYEAFMEEIKNVEGYNVSTFDVFAENLTYFGQDLFNAFGKMQNGEELTAIEQASVDSMNKARQALSPADIVVFAFPLWNQTIPAALQSFIDYTYGAGYSFKYNEQGQKEFLLSDKKVILLNARGGFYNTPELNAMEMSMNYMRAAIQNFFGFEIIDEVIIEGHAQDRENASTIIAEGLEKVKEVAAQL